MEKPGKRASPVYFAPERPTVAHSGSPLARQLPLPPAPLRMAAPDRLS